MSVTVLQLQALLANPAPNPFLQRVRQALTLAAENISSEAGGTALHAQRKALAAQIINNPDQYLPDMAEAVVAQITLATTNLVTANGVANSDVDTTDASLGTIISSVYNDFFP